MFNFLRNLTKSAEEKRQEQLQAYASGALEGKERTQFEATLANDPQLQAELDDIQRLRQRFRQLPQRRVPRNFMLDPSAYGKPEAQPLLQLYPAMRVATVLTAVFLVIAIGADLFTQTNLSQADVAMAPLVLETESTDADAMEAAGAEIVATQTATESVAEESEEASADDTANIDTFSSEPVEESAPMTMDSDAEEMAESTMAEEEATETPTPTATNLPSADTPRIAATPTLEDRAASPPEGTAVALAPTVESVETVEEGANGELTAVEANNTQRTNQLIQLTPLRITQIGLAILLIGLLMILQYARMNQ